jgi:hypothetical protein
LRWNRARRGPDLGLDRDRREWSGGWWDRRDRPGIRRQERRDCFQFAVFIKNSARHSRFVVKVGRPEISLPDQPGVGYYLPIIVKILTHVIQSFEEGQGLFSESLACLKPWLRLVY